MLMLRHRLCLIAALVVAAGCSDVTRPPATAPRFAAAPGGAGITLDQSSATLDDGTPSGQGGTHVGKGFLPSNPHTGDAIVATFFWQGWTNTITTVADHLCDANSTPTGNVYRLVDYVTAGGHSHRTPPAPPPPVQCS